MAKSGLRSFLNACYHVTSYQVPFYSMLNVSVYFARTAANMEPITMQPCTEVGSHKCSCDNLLQWGDCMTSYTCLPFCGIPICHILCIVGVIG